LAVAALHQMWRPFVTVGDGNAGPVLSYDVPPTV
jgi:hypothetical protein